MFRLRSLPAGEGDALWLEWGHETERRMIIDMGRSSHGEAIRAILEEIPEAERTVELLIITHVDRDHIEGVLSGFAKVAEPSGTKFRSIWFNGWNHLHGMHYGAEPKPFKRGPGDQVIGEGVNTMGAVQGETLTPWVAQSGVWNSHFEGGPVIRPEGGVGPKIELAGGLKITVLGPTQSILEEFVDAWAEEIIELEKEKRTTIGAHVDQQLGEGVLTMGRTKPTKPELERREDLEALAAKGEGVVDTKPANGSSICVVVEYEGHRLLLTGDAHADNLIAALDLLPEEERRFDLVKLPHHGSAKNVTAELIGKLDCGSFLISTSGSYFYHPDAEAIARIILHAKHPEPTIRFNVPSEFNGWWDNEEWRDRFGYKTQYGHLVDGLELTFAED